MFSEDYFKTLSPIDRRQVLEDNADDIKDGEYFKPLTDEQLHALRETFTEKAIEKAKLSEELKRFQADMKVKMTPVENAITDLLSSIRSRGNTITGTLFYLADHESGMMNVFNVDGELIESRRLRPDERTTTIKFEKSKTA